MPAKSQRDLFETVPTVPAEELIKLEKNLSSISFFTSSNRNGRPPKPETKPVRTIEFTTRDVNGKQVHPRATILGHVIHGLPTPSDRDRYMAFMSIVSDLRAKYGHVTNPIEFTTYDLLARAGLSNSGRNYEETSQFFSRMVSTTIESEWTVYSEGRKQFKADLYHVFDRAILTGQELPDGSIAQTNYVFLSDWQLQNINSNYTFPADYAAYRTLTKDVAKTVFGHLHTWFFATRGNPVKKNYAEFCKFFDLQQYKFASKARQVLSPSMTELVDIGYLKEWSLDPAADKTELNLCLTPGARILKVIRPRLGERASVVEDPKMEEAVKALVDRGIRESEARQTLFAVDLDKQDVMGQIAYCDNAIRRNRKGFRNPPGFILSHIKENRTSLPRLLPEILSENEELQCYFTWLYGEADQEIARRYNPSELSKELTRLAKALYPGKDNSPSQADRLAEARDKLRICVAADLGLPSFAEYQDRKSALRP